MAKEDILLRSTSNPPLTTKGSALTWAELDANWIEIYDAFVALSQSSYVAAYDNAVEYDDTINNYVTYSSQIWKFINATPATNVTPTEGATWTKVFATDLVNRPLPIDGVKRYKALLSQNAPVATTQTPSIIAGQIWEDTIGTADAGDLVILGGYELISGTLGAVNAKYRSATNDTPNFTTSSLAYDGSPYIVSTDVNGDLNPFINTIGNIVWSYSSDGTFLATLTGAFLDKKVSPTLNNFPTNGSARILRISNNQVRVITYDSLYVETNDILLRSTVEIEVYP